MSQPNDPHSSGQIPMPYRRASAQRVLAQNQAPRRAITPPDTSDYEGEPVSQQRPSVNDLLWYSICTLLSLACIITLGYWLWRITNGQVDSTKLAILIMIVLIYALCIGCGWLWGKYQNAPIQEALEKQVESLQQRVEYLTRENQNLQQTLRQQNSASPRVDPNQSAITVRRVSPQPTPHHDAPARVVPDTSIYEQQIEPIDNSDILLHPHEKRFPLPDEQNALGYNWRLIGASRRGYGHGYEGKYREDDFQIKILNDPTAGPTLAIVALADGLSSKDLSRKGALASVEGATAISEQQVAQLKTLLSHNSDSEKVHAVAKSILLLALHNASDAVVHAARNARVSLEDLHTTLLVFLVAPLGPDQLFLASVQIGDGAMFGVRASSKNDEPPNARWKQLLAPQIQATGNEVQPFMRSQERDWLQFMQFNTLSTIAGVMAMTDGIADDIEPPPPTSKEPEPDPFSMVDRFHQTYIVPTLQSPYPAAELVRSIGYHRSQSIDDRTLVYLYHR